MSNFQNGFGYHGTSSEIPIKCNVRKLFVSILNFIAHHFSKVYLHNLLRLIVGNIVVKPTREFCADLPPSGIYSDSEFYLALVNIFLVCFNELVIEGNIFGLDIFQKILVVRLLIHRCQIGNVLNVKENAVFMESSDGFSPFMSLSTYSFRSLKSPLSRPF